MGFEFSDSAAKIEICGKVYEVDPYSDNTLTSVNEYQKALQKASAKGSEDTPESVREVCGIAARLVDALLGKGVHAKIFKGREADFIAHQELVCFILGTLTAYRSARVKDAMTLGMEAAKSVMLNKAETAK